METGQVASYASLVEDGRVHSAIYTDESIFQAELERIFYSDWLYLAHESEVADPGDYCTKWIGRKQVIVARGVDGKIRAFFNRCRHRGSTVCQYKSGNAGFFRCPYHGWTYNNAGQLIGVPFHSRYGSEFNKDDLGLAPVSNLDRYCGFIFASLSDTAPPLLEHLGEAARFIEMFVRASPAESVELRAGASKTQFRGNWKFVGMDGYHANFTHKTVLDLQRRRNGGSAGASSNTDRSPNQTVDLGGGHCRLDLSRIDAVEIGKRSTNTLAGEIPDSESGRRYLAAMTERWGSDSAAAEIIRESRDVHLHVWPNLQLIGSEVRVIRPVSAGVTEVVGYPAMLADVPEEINERRLRAYEWFNGCAGFGSPDDSEVFERNQIGLQCDREPWLVISRGLGMSHDRPDGGSVGNITDEVTQRAQLHQWAREMG